MDATLALGLISQLLPLLAAAPETIANAARMHSIMQDAHSTGRQLTNAEWDEIHAIRKHMEELALAAAATPTAEPDTAPDQVAEAVAKQKAATST